MFKFFHHLFNPHCPDCIEEKKCSSCDVLRAMLESANYEKAQLLQTILNFGKPPEVVSSPVEDFKPIPSQRMPWNVRRQLLEQEDRAKAKILRDKEKESNEIAKLEKELKIEPEEKEGTNGANRTV